MTDTTAGEGVTDRFLSWLEHEIDEASMGIGAAHQEGGTATEAEKERASCLGFVRDRYLALSAERERVADMQRRLDLWEPKPTSGSSIAVSSRIGGNNAPLATQKAEGAET